MSYACFPHNIRLHINRMAATQLYDLCVHTCTASVGPLERARVAAGECLHFALPVAIRAEFAGFQFWRLF